MAGPVTGSGVEKPPRRPRCGRGVGAMQAGVPTGVLLPSDPPAGTSIWSGGGALRARGQGERPPDRASVLCALSKAPAPSPPPLLLLCLGSTAAAPTHGAATSRDGCLISAAC